MINLQKHMRALTITLVSFVIVSFPSHGQFVDVAGQFGIAVFNNNPLQGNGVSFADFDGDGWEDLTFMTKNQEPKFYKNEQGTLTEVTLNFNPALPANVDYKCGIWVDYDNDGDKDFIFSAITNNTYGNYPLKVYRNDGETGFVEVSSAIGILPETPLINGIAAGDMDNDGDLDLFVTKFHNSVLFSAYMYCNRLYRNNGNGTFTDVTIERGIGTLVQPSFNSIWIDYDQDGDQDIYVFNDRYSNPNRLYRNDGTGYFTDVSQTSGAGISIDAMSATADDFDNDGDLDIFVSNTASGPLHADNNYLLRNNGNGTFTDIGANAGIMIESHTCWAGLWLDYDNDSWRDLYIANIGSQLTIQSQNYFFINNQNGTFSNGNAITGIEGVLEGTYCSAMGDFNHDGYYDFVNNNVLPNNASLWRNSGGTNNHLTVTVQGTISNRDGIGTWIECYACGNKYVNYTYSSENYNGQNSPREIFGLGTCSSVDSVVVRWLSGMVETYYNLPVNGYHHFIEGASFADIIYSITTSSADLIICPGETSGIVLEANCTEPVLWNTGETTQSIVAYQAGQYWAVATNNWGIEIYTDTISISASENFQWQVLTNPVSCAGFTDGSIMLLQVPDDYAIEWSTGNSGNSLQQLASGIYTYTITDNLGCQFSGVVNLDGPLPLAANMEVVQPVCYGNNGSATCSVSGGTPPYVINWQGANPAQLPPGAGEIFISDANNCTITANYEVVAGATISLDVSITDASAAYGNGSACIEASGGTEPYLFQWSSGSISNCETSIPQGQYEVTVTDAQGCYVSEIITIGYNSIAEVYSMSMIWPIPADAEVHVQHTWPIYELEVLNLSGQHIQKILNLRGSYSVEFEVADLPSGIYFVLLKGESAGQLAYLKLLKR